MGTQLDVNSPTTDIDSTLISRLQIGACTAHRLFWQGQVGLDSVNLFLFGFLFGEELLQ